MAPSLTKIDIEPQTPNPEEDKHPKLEEQRRHEMLVLCFSIGLYCTVSISLVFVNRILFSDIFPYPVFISWLQSCFGFVLFNVFNCVGYLIPPLQFFRITKPKLSVALKVFPLSVAFACMVGFSNICLKYVQISTYQVARSLTLLFNLILCRSLLKMQISTLSWVACMVVIAGFVINSFDTATFSVMGATFGAASSLFQAIYNVYIKVTLAHVDKKESALLYYNSGLTSVILFPAIFLAGEKNVFSALPFDFALSSTWNIWAGLITSALLGLLISFATYLCVRVTSPVTYNVTGYAKSCVQSVGGIVFLGEVITLTSLSGIVLTLTGSAMYSAIKMREMRQATDYTLVKTGKEVEIP